MVKTQYVSIGAPAENVPIPPQMFEPFLVLFRKMEALNERGKIKSQNLMETKIDRVFQPLVIQLVLPRTRLVGVTPEALRYHSQRGTRVIFTIQSLDIGKIGFNALKPASSERSLERCSKFFARNFDLRVAHQCLFRRDFVFLVQERSGNKGHNLTAINSKIE